MSDNYNFTGQDNVRRGYTVETEERPLNIDDAYDRGPREPYNPGTQGQPRRGWDGRSGRSQPGNGDLPPFEITPDADNRQNEAAERQRLVRELAVETVASGKFSNDVKNFLLKEMNAGGPNGLQQAVQELDRAVIAESRRGGGFVPAQQQLRVIFRHERDHQTGDEHWEVGLMNRRSPQDIDHFEIRPSRH